MRRSDETKDCRYLAAGGIKMSPAAIVILYPLHGVAILLLCRSRFDKKKTWLVCIAAAVLQIVVALGLYGVVQGKKWIYGVFSITFLILMAEVFYLSAENFPKTMFLAMTYTQAFLIAAFFGGLLSNWMFGGSIKAASCIRTIFHATGLTAYGMVFKEKFEEVRNDVITGWWPMCFLSLIYTIYVIYLTLTTQAEYFQNADVVSFALLLVAVIMGYGVIFHTVHYMREAALNSQIEQHQSILLKKLEIMEESEEAARRLRHDFRHHIRNITEYVRKGETKELLHYLGEYSGEIEKTARQRICANPVIDNVLTVYVNQACKEGIQVDFDISTDKDGGIGAVDMVAILANLMENAIHGCHESGKEHKTIRVQMGTKAGKLFIVVENTCKEEILFKDGLPDRSRLRQRKGIGISSIMKSVEKYGGDVDFRSENGKFISRIIVSG